MGGAQADCLPEPRDVFKFLKVRVHVAHLPSQQTHCSPMT